MEGLEMKIGWVILLLAIAGLAIQPLRVQAQSAAGSGDFATTPGAPKSTQYPDLTYRRPTQKTKLHNYFFDAFGPYPIVGASVAAGINQADRTPPEWGQGAEGYGKRFASNFGIAIVSTTTRYGLAQTRCITAVSARDFFRGWAMPPFLPSPRAAAMMVIGSFRFPA
jgi:hypothetical protein